MKQKLLLIAFLSCLLSWNAVKATETEPNNTPATANTLALNGSNSGAINPAGDVDWFKVTTTSDGQLNITLNDSSSSYYANVYLYDNDGVTLIHNGTATTNSSITISTDGLAAGTYYVEVTAYTSGQTPTYSLSNTLTPASGANDAEPDSSRATALTLALDGSTTGHIGYYYNDHRDSADEFKVTTNADGLLRVTLTDNTSQSENYYVNFTVYDNDGVTPVFNTNHASYNSPFVASIDGLAAGTYYIKITQYDNTQFAPYTLADSLFSPSQANDNEPDSNRATALTLALNGGTTGHIGYYYNNHRDSADEYKVTTNADGLLRVTLTDNTSQIENYYVNFTVYDNDGITPVFTTNHASFNTPFVASIDGLAAGTYYIKITQYNNTQFAPYTLADSLFSPSQANDNEPDSNRATALTLPLNGSKTGHIGYYYNNHRDSADEYKVTTNADGLLRVTLTDNTTQNENYFVNLTVYDNDGATLIFSTNHASFGTPLVASIDGLAAGTYYIKITPYSNVQFAPYTLADSLFKPAQANDNEPDSDRTTALTLPLNGSTTGHIGYYYNNHRDSADEYKVTTNADGLLQVTLTDNTPQSENFYVNMTIYDNDGVTLIFNTNHSSFGTPLVANIDGLAAGTYYIKITPYSNGQFAPYTLADALITPAQANDAEPDSSRATALSLPLNGSTTGHIGYYYNNHRDSADEYKVTTNADGMLQVTLTDNTPNNENYYVNMTVYDNDGVTVLFNTNHSSFGTPLVANIDGLAAGTYYIRITPYSNGQFAPYTLSNTLFTYNANDPEPNNSAYQASTLPANGTVTGHLNFYYNGARDNTDWFKINYTGAGSLNFDVEILPHISNNAIDFINFYVYKDTTASPIYSSTLTNASNTFGLSSLTQGYYWVKLNYYNTADFLAYSISPTFTQVTKAAIKDTKANSAALCADKSSITLQCSGSNAPYTVQLYRFGIAYGNSFIIPNTSDFTIDTLAFGSYYATVYGDGATGTAFGTSKDFKLVAKPSELTTTNIGNTRAILHWKSLPCINYYKVEYHTAAGDTAWKMKNVPNNDSTMLTGLIAGTTYEWRVSSVDSANNITAVGKYSDSVSFTTTTPGIFDDAVNNTEIKDADINIYPNPASSQLHIQLNGMAVNSDSKALLVLKDMNGKIMWSNENSSASSSVNVDVSRLPAGIYFLQIIQSNGGITKKIIIAR